MQEHNSSISNFKHFLTKILLPFIAITSVAGWLFSFIFERKIIMNSEISGAYKVNRIIRETHPDEIPIIGSSRAKSGYIPDSLGNNFFNYGLNGSGADVAIFFLRRECMKKKKRPWIIINTDLAGLTRLYGNIANYIPNSKYREVRAIMGNDYQSYYRIPFVKYFGQYEHYMRAYLNDKIQLTKIVNNGAALEIEVLPPIQFEGLVATRKIYGDTLEIDTTLLHDLTGIITSNPDRQFVFVVAPYHKSYYESYGNIAAAESYLRFLDSYPNTHVLNFGHMELSDDMYFNTSHLHFKGAVEFCHALRDSLVALGVK